MEYEFLRVVALYGPSPNDPHYHKMCGLFFLNMRSEYGSHIHIPIEDGRLSTRITISRCIGHTKEDKDKDALEGAPS